MKKFLSIFLTLCILLSVFSIVPFSAGAAEASDQKLGSQGDVLYVLGDSIGEGFLQNGKYCKSWVRNVIETNGYDVDKSLGYYDTTRPDNSQPTRLGESGLGFVTRGAWSKYVNHYLTKSFDGTAINYGNADKVVVALGINDWKATNVTLTAFFSSMENVFKTIRQQNPDCELYYLLPFNAGFTGNYNTHYALNQALDSDKTKTNGYSLRQFGNLILSKLQEEPFSSLNIQPIDMMTCDAINRDTIRDGALYRPTTHADDLHPIAATHVELAKELSKRLEAHGHLLTEHPATDATCADGNTAYWSCSDEGCGKFFSDANAENEIAENSWVIPATTAHTPTGETSWAWTGNDSSGYTAASVSLHCSVCGQGETVAATVTRTHANGQTVYSAEATSANGQHFTDSKTVEGKILYVLGDSIALGIGPNGGTVPSWVSNVIDTNGYLPLGTNGSKNLSQLNIGFNYPSVGTAQNIANSTDFSDADTVAVALGIFDWRDTSASRTNLNNQFYPALYNLFSKIRSDNANCKIYFVLPFNDGRVGNYDTYYAKNKAVAPDYKPTYIRGYSLREFCDLIKAKFQENNYKALDVKLIDMLECEAINRDTIKNQEVSGANQSQFLPNAATHELLGQELAKRLEANGHLLTEHPASGADCVSSGSSAYWFCEDEDCGKFFSDEHAENEIAENSWIIPAQGAHGTFVNPEWTWTGTDLDGYTSAKVKVTCSACGTQENLTAAINKSHSNGQSVFTATATASNGQVFTDTKTVEGKTLYVLGDSIALGYDTESPEAIGAENSWVQHVIDNNGYLPLGNNGSKNLSKIAIGFCRKKPNESINAYSIALENDFSGADTVAVALGINDWKQTETDEVSFSSLYTAMYNVFSKIRNDNPSCEIYFILPFNANVSPGGSYETHYSLNKAIVPEPYMDYCSGYTLREFADFIKAKFEEDNYKALNVTLIDMLECEAINRDTIKNDGALYDNLHPSKSAHALLGAEISQRLNAKGHLLTKHEAVAATCVDGSAKYWSCSDAGCGKFFSDEFAENEIAENSWVIPAANDHTFSVSWDWTGNDEDGYTDAMATVSCSVCGKQENIAAAVTKTYTPENSVYTAVATASDGQQFTDTKTVDGQEFSTGHSLSLLGDIGLNFFYNLSAEQAANATVDFTWQVNEVEKTSSVNLSTVTKGDNGYKAACNIAPAEMSSVVTATLKIDGEVTATDTYSVRQYADNVRNNAKFRTQYIAQYGQDKYDALVDLVRAMLDYGARAQVRFDKNTDTLVNEGTYFFTDPVDTALIPNTMSDMRKNLSDYGLEYAGSSVVLLTKTSIRHYYTITEPEKYSTISGVTFNGTAANVINTGNEVCFELENIAAADLDSVYTLKIGSSDYNYSVFDYIRRCLEKEDANQLTQDLVASMYYYNRKAKTFFGKPIVEPERYEWNQTSELVRNYLTAAKASYDPSDYTNSVIADYAPTERSLENERPSGYTFNIKQAGTLTIGDYSKQVAAGSYTAYNVIPNSSTTFTVTDQNGMILQWGTLNPTHYLRQIKSTNSRNTRDLGGWACDGGTIKYGKIIRGGIVEPVTAEDRDVFVNQLGIRTEIELRGKNDNNWTETYPVPTSSGLGDDVEFHIYDDFAWYGFSKTELCRQILGDIFDAVKNDKPVYIHCHAGADRTGTISFILEAILGMSQTDMDTDFELTTYYVGGKNARCRNDSEGWVSMINQIKAYSGATFRDKAVNCVLGLGFTIDDINDFRAKMIDGTPEILTVN